MSFRRKPERTRRGPYAVHAVARLVLTVAAFVAIVSFVRAEPVAGAQPELIERTLAIVGDQVITLSDVRTAVALRLVETEAGRDPIDAATARLIDRALMLREVQHYAPPEPPPAAVEQRVAFSRDRFPSADAFQAALDAGGFSEERLRAWIRDDLRVAAYLDQRFAAAGVPTDPEVIAYYNEHWTEFDRGGLGYAEAVPLIRERLAGERRRELITDWLSDLRRRTEVVRISDLQGGPIALMACLERLSTQRADRPGRPITISGMPPPVRLR